MADPAVLIAYSDEPTLGARIVELTAHGRVVLLTDDGDAIPAHPQLEVIEPEDLIPDGPACVEQTWETGVEAWMHQIFDASLVHLLSVNLNNQPRLTERPFAAALTRRFFERWSPSSVEIVGRLPIAYVTVPGEARRRGVTVRGERRRPGVVQTARGVLTAAALMGVHGARLVARTIGRKRELNRLAQYCKLTTDSPPKLYVSFGPKWYQSARHVIDSILRPLDERGTPYGILFASTFGEGGERKEGNVDALALFDGRLARLRPAHVSHVSGVDSLGDCARLLASWLPQSARASWRAIRLADALMVGGQSASLRDDDRALLSVTTNDLLRVMEARYATERWLSRNRAPEHVLFAHAPSGEIKVVDELLQQQGAITIDFAHGAAYEANLRTIWRSSSVYHLSWTLHEQAQFERLGANRVCLGGFMPRIAVAQRRAHAGKRVLVVTNYIHDFYLVDGRHTALKHARRLAACLSQLVSHLDGRAQVVLRPHPHEDRAAWQRLFAERPAPSLSDRKSLTDDLADADLVIATKTSGAIEAVACGIPVLFHRGLPVDPSSLFGLVPNHRWFTAGDQLCRRVDELLANPLDLAPERLLMDACFGQSGQPVAVLPWVERLVS